jgi:hypothetical protein
MLTDRTVRLEMPERQVRDLLLGSVSRAESSRARDRSGCSQSRGPRTWA